MIIVNGSFIIMTRKGEFVNVLPRLKDSPIVEDWTTQSRSTEFSQSKECVRFNRFLNREAYFVSITVCSKLCVVQFGTL